MDSDPATGGGAGRDFAFAQIIDRAVVSTEILDILAAAGLAMPDISILSGDFLAEVAQMEKKNLALPAGRRGADGLAQAEALSVQRAA